MKMDRLFIVITLMSAAFVGCKHDPEKNKVVDSLPIHMNESCPPAQISQAWFALKRDMLALLVPVVNRLGLTGSTYPELTSDGNMQYSFRLQNRHYGNATYTIEFKNSTGGTIDPITDPTHTSSTTLKSILINGVGTISSTNYKEELTLDLDTLGDTSGNKHLYGTSLFNDGSYSITFTFVSGGAPCTYQGMTDGRVDATGTGPGAPVTLMMMFYPEHTANGSVAWEGNSGNMHFEENATGFVITDQYRLPLD